VRKKKNSRKRKCRNTEDLLIRGKEQKRSVEADGGGPGGRGTSGSENSKIDRGETIGLYVK